MTRPQPAAQPVRGLDSGQRQDAVRPASKTTRRTPVVRKLTASGIWFFNGCVRPAALEAEAAEAEERGSTHALD